MFLKNREKNNSGPTEDTILIVGLGNVGERYFKTRHNVGFKLVDFLASKYKANWKRTKHEAAVASFNLSGTRVILAKPTTLMNNSGRAVQKLMKFYKLTTEQIVIAYDDVDIDLGKIRIRERGSAGSHNGMRSIVQYIKTNEFVRIRIGIGPRPEHYDMINFVLGTFTTKEEDLLDEAIYLAVGASETIITRNTQTAMNQYNNH